MAGLTRYGTIWGQIPNTAGQVFWVAPGTGAYTVGGKTYDAGDGNDGQDPRRAKATIDSAVNSCTANSGDVIVCLPGTHALTASVAMDVAGVTLMGLPGGAGNIMRQKTTIDGTALTTDQCINVTAANCEIAYLNVIPLTGDSGIDFSVDANSIHIHHCSFDMVTPAVSTGTIGIDAIGAASDVLIDNCSFISDGAQGAAIVVGDCTTVTIEHNLFQCTASTWVSTITQAAAGRNLVVRYNDWFVGAGAAITNGCLGTTGGIAEMAFFIGNHNSTDVTKLVDGYDAGDACVAVNYIGTVGGGTGGTLVTLTT